MTTTLKNQLSGKLVGQWQAEGLRKASGLELRQHHGAQAGGLCGVVT